MKKTGYELTRNWFDWAFDNPDLNNINMAALYLWFVEKNNRCGWAEKFSVTASESMSCLGIKSRNTYNKAFNDLVEHKFIIIVTRATNQNTCNVISLNQNLIKREFSRRSALDSAIIQQVCKRDDGTCASSDTINKQVNNKTSNIKEANASPTEKIQLELKTETLTEERLHGSVVVATIEQRKELFGMKVIQTIGDGNPKTIEKFISYWGEYSDGGKKMRYEKETVFDIKRRWNTWSANEKKYNQEQQDTNTFKIGKQVS